MISFGKSQGDYLWSWNPVGKSGGPEITLNGEIWSVPLPGVHNGANLAAAIVTARAVGLSDTQIKAGLAGFRVSEHRSGVLEIGGCTILDDAYNANPASMAAAAEAVAQLPGSGRVLAVLGHMAELGPDSDDLHRSTGLDLAAGGIDLLVTVGPLAAPLAEGFVRGEGQNVSCRGYPGGGRLAAGKLAQWRPHPDQGIPQRGHGATHSPAGKSPGEEGYRRMKPDVAGKLYWVVGLARSGCAAGALLRRHGARVIGVDDAAEDAVSIRWEREGLTNMAPQAFDEIATGGDWPSAAPHAIVISPGVPPDHPQLKKLGKDVPVLGEMELASRFCEADIVAITGTNGKSTTTELIAHLVRKCGRRAEALGNLGTPLSQVVDDLPSGAVVSLEVSSFQLETVKEFQPRVGLVLNLAPDHLDRYAGPGRLLRRQGNSGPAGGSRRHLHHLDPVS